MRFHAWLILAALPYVAVTAYDTWMHSHDRVVPSVERWLHAGILVFVALFLVLSVAGVNFWAWACLLACLPMMAVDELGYHQDLHMKEKKIHYLAGACFVFYVVVWVWMT